MLGLPAQLLQHPMLLSYMAHSLSVDTNRPQAVILMGIPASGKSTFCTRCFGEEAGYVRINHDTLRSWERVWSLLLKCLSTRRSFVMDNTQVLRADRARIIALAAAAGYEVSGYYLQSRLADCLCRNETRKGQAIVPRAALLNMAARLELPSYAEGFDRLYHVAWAAGVDYTVSPWQERRARPFPWRWGNPPRSIAACTMCATARACGIISAGGGQMPSAMLSTATAIGRCAETDFLPPRRMPNCAA